MHQNHRALLMLVGSLERTSEGALYQSSEWDYLTTYYAIKGCLAHKWIEDCCGEYELTEKGLKAYDEQT